ncbi:MAG: hypothetical protein MHPSP_001054 [Paramarteilia canceri]
MNEFSHEICFNPTKIKNSKLGLEILTGKYNRHFIGNIDENSEAYIAGLRSRDELIGINGNEIVGIDHSNALNILQDNLDKEIRFRIIRSSCTYKNSITDERKKSRALERYTSESGMKSCIKISEASEEKRISVENLRELQVHLDPIRHAKFRFDGPIANRIRSLNELLNNS